MARYIPEEWEQNRLLAINFEKQIQPGTIEFAIHVLVEKWVDMSVFESKYKNDEAGRPAYNPKTLLKVVLLGYSRGLISSRDIEKACGDSVTFMALSCDRRPDHSTIAAFVSSMEDQILPLFRDILMVCDSLNLLGDTLFALDGCKMPSNASLHKSGKHDKLKRVQERIEKKIRQLIKDHVKQDSSLEGVVNAYKDEKIDKLWKEADKIKNFLEENEPKIGKRGKEIQSNITDNDSASMKTSHGTTQGYNPQAFVDDKKQVIAGAMAMGDGQDHDHLGPMIEEVKKNFKAIGKPENYLEGKTVLADANYHSANNIRKSNEEKLDAYIPDKDFRTRDPRFTTRKGGKIKSTKFSFDDFIYDKDKDQYICPNKKRLLFDRKINRKRKGVEVRYIAAEDDCRDCHLRDKCLHKKGAKKRWLTFGSDESKRNICHEMIKKIETEEGRKEYNKRIGIIEPVFGNMRTCKGMNRFTLRGKTKVNIQWLLYCMVHNIGKIAKYGFT